MIGRRIVYGVALLAALAFQIFYDGYLAQFLLVCVIALPLLSLALSLRAAVGVRLELTPSLPQLVQEESGAWEISVKTRSFLPVPRLTMALTLQNSLTGTKQRERLGFTGLSQGMVRTIPMDTSHCGLLTCQLSRVRVLDALGLFAFPVSAATPAHALVLPNPVPMEQLPEFPQVPADTICTGTPSIEDYELREYRPGDSLRSIHWKLSSKHDSLVVREPVKHGLPQVAVTFDLFGDGKRLDRVLGRLWWASLALVGRDISHKILWIDPECGQQEQTVSSQAQLLAAMTAILSRPAPAEQSSAPLELSHLGQMPRLHVTTGEEDAP